MTNDLVSDMLTRIRNSSMARHTYVRVRYSKLNLAILKVLETESYIDSYVIEQENNPKQNIKIFSNGRIQMTGVKKKVEGMEALNLILDKAKQKGTGRLASIAALELGVAAPSISEAVSARILSSKKSERIYSARIFEKPNENHTNLAIRDIKKALLAAKISVYAQGFEVLSAANKEYSWDMNLAEIARNWRAGCIIQARFLDDVAIAFATDAELTNLIVAPHFSSILKESIPSLRTVIKWAITKGIPSAVFSASLTYFETYTSLNLPANLIQGQRDYFGSHGFERIDKPGIYTSDWK